MDKILYKNKEFYNGQYEEIEKGLRKKTGCKFIRGSKI